MKLLFFLLTFWTMQVLANVAFKFGSFGSHGRSRRWLAGFILGNIVGASSIYFVMKIYELMAFNPNLAAVLAGAGGSIGSQVTLALLFHSRLSKIQWAGVVVVSIGTAVAVLGGPSAIGASH